MANTMLSDADCISVFAVIDIKIVLNLLAKWSPEFQETECRAQANTQKVKTASPKQSKEERAKSGNPFRLSCKGGENRSW